MARDTAYSSKLIRGKVASIAVFVLVNVGVDLTQARLWGIEDMPVQASVVAMLASRNARTLARKEASIASSQHRIRFA